MMKRYIAYIIVILVAFMNGCTDSKLMPDMQCEIDVCLNFCRVQPGYSTKASMEVTALESTDIKNLWVMQFDGTSAGSGLLMARYYPDYVPGTRIKLLTSDVENYLLFVVNTNNPSIEFSKCRTLDDVKQLNMHVLSDTQAAGWYSSGHYEMIMNGHAQAVVTGASLSLDVPLMRNAVRLDVKITNTSGSTANPITIDSVGLCSGVAFMDYYTDYTLPDKYPSQYLEHALPYPATAWADGQLDGSARCFTFYCPATKRGVTTASDPKLKNLLAPQGATYVKLYGTDSHGSVVSYRFCVGNDLASDCNLLPNTDYSYELTISSEGDYATDSRVENLNMQDFTQAPLANSYMIQPPSVNGVWKHVRIPVQRVHDFWNETDGYERVSANSLDINSYGWQAEIIRSTVELIEDVNFKWIKRTGTDYTDYFEYAISAGLEGNFVLGVHRYTDKGRTTLDDVFLWSWHMWVTDYNPDATLSLLTPVVDSDGKEAQFAYDVVGGQVNRYYADIWKAGGTLEGQFMMDRNLGELSVTGREKPCILVYQFGRKDPFPYESSITGARYKGYTIYNRYNDESAFPYRTSTQLSNENETKTVSYCIYHPEVYILIESNWTRGDRDASNNLYINSYNWIDTKIGSDYTVKSMFDPCPAGWRVPPYNAIQFPDNTTSQVSFYEHKRILPNGVVMRYPVAGIFHGGYYQYNPSNTWGLWSNTSYNANSGWILFGAGTNVNQYNAATYKGKGLPVRCVSYTEP